MMIAVGEAMRSLVKVLEDAEQYTGDVFWAPDAMAAHDILAAHRSERMNILIKGPEVSSLRRFGKRCSARSMT